jgi:hypothetical protein
MLSFILDAYEERLLAKTAGQEAYDHAMEVSYTIYYDVPVSIKYLLVVTLFGETGWYILNELKLLQICELLAEDLDKVRKGYWNFIKTKFVSKFGSSMKESRGESMEDEKRA